MINSFAKTILLEDKNAGRMSTFTYQDYALRWKVNHELKLIFAVVYKEILQLAFVEELIQMIKLEFVNKVMPKFEKKGDVFISLHP